MNHIEKTIGELENQILQKQKELEGLQIATNHLCKLLNPDSPPRYEIKGQNATMTSIRLKGDEYYKKAKATAITLILQDRRAKNMGPATIEEICKKMAEGGYEFEAKDPVISIGTALGKNVKFTRIGDKWGLTEWYTTVAETPQKRGRPRKQRQQPEKANEENNLKEKE